MEPLSFFFAQCRAALADQGGLIASLWVAGLAGGVSHCAAMCGPFVLAQVGARLEACPAAKMSEAGRFWGAALIPYHLGRVALYTAFGALAGGLAGRAGPAFELGRPLAAAMLALAALLFLAYALPGLGWKPALGGALGSRLAGLARPLLAAPTGWRGFRLGLLLGFIPCGLLYAGLAASAASGDPWAGGLALFAFAVGTVPGLLAVGAVGHLAAGRWRRLAMRVGPMLLGLNALVLMLLAVKTLR